jgi:putative spermidine/putrescine transport system permease protein
VAGTDVIRRHSSTVWWLLIPALAVNLSVFLFPMLNLGGLSLREGLPGGGLGESATLLTWRQLLTDPFYRDLLGFSLRTAFVITLLALVCSYPIALFVHRASDRWRNLLIVACISPLLLSAVVRTYGWMLILGDQGFVANVLRGLGIEDPPRMVFNDFGVIIGLAEIMMPYMILCLLAGFGRLDRTLEDAAASLGAPPFTVFRRIVFPLSLPGVLLGCLITFVLAISSFVTPKLLGGGWVLLLATEIYDQAMLTMNWPVAAALSIVTLVVFGLALFVYGRTTTRLERGSVRGTG